jgi:hypothetical protein
VWARLLARSESKPACQLEPLHVLELADFLDHLRRVEGEPRSLRACAHDRIQRRNKRDIGVNSAQNIAPRLLFPVIDSIGIGRKWRSQPKERNDFMAIKEKDQQALDDIFAQCRGKYAGRKEDYFALQYLTNRFKVDLDNVAYQVAFGGNDYGLDAYYIDRGSHNLYLYQFKWSENHNLFKDSMIRLAEDGISRIFGNPRQDASQNELLIYLKRELNEVRDQIARVYIHFIFKGDVDAAENSDGLLNRREYIESRGHLISSYFGREVELQVDYIADKPGKKGPPPSQSYEITLGQHIETAHDDVKMRAGPGNLHRAISGVSA